MHKHTDYIIYICTSIQIFRF